MRWGAGSGGPSGDGVEHFDTGGRVAGYLGVLASAGLVVVWLTQLATSHPLPLPVLTGALLAGVLFWSAILRPRVWASGETLVLRNMLETVLVPLAAIEEHALRQVLAVRVGDKRYVASGLGRSLRNSALGSKPSRTAERGGFASQVVDAADFAESRIGVLAAEARERAGIQRYSDEQLALGRDVRRVPARPVLAALAVTVVLLVVSIVAT